MNTEFDKILTFVAEVRKQWPRHPDLVLSRQFYALWEELQKPLPFQVPASGLQIGEQALELASGEELIGYFCWDEEDMCPCLVLEGAMITQRVLFLIQDGEVVVEETPPISLEEDTLGFGERLEIIYDVIAYTRETYPAFDVRELRGRRFLEGLDGIAAWHDPRSIRIMRRMPAQFRDRLVRRAVEEMAVDERSNQLELPLDGTYASGDSESLSNAEDTAGEFSGSDRLGLCRMEPRTDWSIERDLRVIGEAVHLCRDLEQTFVLTFGQTEILERDERTVVLRVNVTEDAPIQEGDRLRVFRHGNRRESLGTFQVFIMEHGALYGSLTWEDPALAAPLDDYLCALPPKSPLNFIADSFAALMHIATQPDQGLSESCMHALGFVASNHEQAVACQIGQLDSSQQQAHDNAVNPHNAIVLIQGPPGTGKTTVLEHILRSLAAQGKRVLVTAPSNTAVDNVCRRVLDLPILRMGYQRQVAAPDIADACWNGDDEAVRAFVEKRRRTGACVYAGTHVGILRSDLIQCEIGEHGCFDAIVFDEAGMARMDEFLLCLQLANRAVVLGDHQQLPPHPLPDTVLAGLREKWPAIPRTQWMLLSGSAMEWLAEVRRFPVVMLQCSYRCQNPRLMRFASTLFYNARVRPREDADYYRLSYAERNRQYPASTLCFCNTAALPEGYRRERLVVEGHKPGFENPAEAALCLEAFVQAAGQFPLEEITLIAPYRRQVKLLRETLTAYRKRAPSDRFPGDEAVWQRFLRTRISTVDSFQGGESDVVIICYVRSNTNHIVGFVDDPNRVNVAHTRSRRRMVIVGDLECLKQGSGNRIFERMERAFRRDGEIIDVRMTDIEPWLSFVPERMADIEDRQESLYEPRTEFQLPSEDV